MCNIDKCSNLTDAGMLVKSTKCSKTKKTKKKRSRSTTYEGYVTEICPTEFRKFALDLEDKIMRGQKSSFYDDDTLPIFNAIHCAQIQHWMHQSEFPVEPINFDKHADCKRYRDNTLLNDNRFTYNNRFMQAVWSWDGDFETGQSPPDCLWPLSFLLICSDDYVVEILEGYSAIWRGDYMHAGAAYAMLNDILFISIQSPRYPISLDVSLND